MGDGKALQMGTSHELGQNFARAFGIQFTDEPGTQQYVWQTSWGVSTRLIGALVMAHGDDFGLRLPPALAPVEVVVMVVRDDEGVRRAAGALVDELRPRRAPGAPRRPDRHRLRPPDRRLGAEGRAGAGGGRARATWPRATSPWSPATAGPRQTVPLGGGGRRGAGRRSAVRAPSSAAEAGGLPARRARSR